MLAPYLVGGSDLGSLRVLQVGQVWVRSVLCKQVWSVGQLGGMPASGRTHYTWSSGFQSVVDIRHSVVGPLRFSELWRVLKQLCLTHVDLASGQGSFTILAVS